jgi:hypothetical protein
MCILRLSQRVVEKFVAFRGFLGLIRCALLLLVVLGQIMPVQQDTFECGVDVVGGLRFVLDDFLGQFHYSLYGDVRFQFPLFLRSIVGTGVVQ